MHQNVLKGEMWFSFLPSFLSDWDDVRKSSLSRVKWLQLRKADAGTLGWPSKEGDWRCCPLGEGLFTSLVPWGCGCLCCPVPFLQPHELCSLPASSGISQARILDWFAISSSRGSSQPRDGTCISHLTGRFFTTEPPGCCEDQWGRQPDLPVVGRPGDRGAAGDQPGSRLVPGVGVEVLGRRETKVRPRLWELRARSFWVQPRFDPSPRRGSTTWRPRAGIAGAEGTSPFGQGQPASRP